MRCNICGGTAFEDMPKRPLARCSTCRSLERTRVAALKITEQVRPQPGAHVLHFAPEQGLSQLLRGIAGDNYRAVDVDPARYAHLGINVEPFDLCRDVFTLPRGRYDLIVHNHVLEHIECNYSVALIRLAQSLSEDGAMLFSVPIVGDDFTDAIVDASDEEKAASFGAFRHYRHFGRRFIAETLGMIFDMAPDYDLTRDFPPAVLREANIPEHHWREFTGTSIFVVRRRDLRV